MAANDTTDQPAGPDAELSAMRRIYEDVTLTLQSMPDLQQAFIQATRLADDLRKMADDAALTRARVAAQIHDAEALSLAALATKLGISKARADQLLKAARNR
ncbi:hypothetical protein HTZ77_20760 [Nonomuraea sp. SMC257]|uniref:Uncharacterized protein n=1 Tax=Nonomuraea montanisoli TaxID=2741721 RepID=A0A7Y6M4U7_9ACTN|nr:hypothetical protein [Nonomuraea montanisoli]NUW33845.1 hypothetical protein [Nonomuraea montanisoli]